MPDTKKTRYASEKDKISTKLIEYAKSKYEFFHNDLGEGFVKVPAKTHSKFLQVNSQEFSDHLRMVSYRKTGRGLSNTILDMVISTLGAVSKYDGKKVKTYQRVAQVNETIFIDLCNDEREVVEVTKFGWKVVRYPRVCFTRTSEMMSLPMPEPGGNIKDLLNHINVDNGNLPLLVAWMLTAMQAGKGAYPILSVDGQAGSGKSTSCRMIKQLIDPNKAPLLSQPKPSDLRVVASGHHVFALDNISRISPEFSDSLCKFSTGENIRVRELYTTNSVLTISIKKPVMLNGITESGTRSDLVSRILSLHLNKIETRKTEEEAWDSFNKSAPKLIGSLLDGLVEALKNYRNTQVEDMTRMADMCIWITAASPAYGWSKNTFIDAYKENLKSTHSNAIEASPFGEAIMNMYEARGGYHGRPANLLNLLENKGYVTDKSKNASSWVRTPRGVVDQLAKLQPSFEALGIHYEKYKDSSNKTFVKIGDKEYVDNKSILAMVDPLKQDKEDLDF
jgi:energy-coupling factor transporter ATP-binding protein EcfA2